MFEIFVRGWIPSAFLSRTEFHFDYSVLAIYRMFKSAVFNFSDLPMKDKRKPKRHQENIVNKHLYALLRNILMTMFLLG